MTETNSAYDITNPMIRQTGEAIRTGDFQLFLRHFAVPLVMETHEEKFLFRSRHEIRKHFDGVRRYRAENKIVDSFRENISAEFYDERTISLVHVSHLLQEGGTVFDRPYPTHSIIRKSGDRWLTYYCLYGVDRMDSFQRALLNFLQGNSPFEASE